VQVVIAPDTVPVGTQFTVTVNSFGSSSCTHPDGADLTIVGGLATISPYDRVPADGADVVCTADVAARPHPVLLRFTAPGSATIRVRGYQYDEQAQQRVIGTVDRTIAIEP
jgi:hypothetical protein